MSLPDRPLPPHENGGAAKKGGKHFPPEPPALAKARSVDDPGGSRFNLYAKHGSSSVSGGNGSVGGGRGAGSRINRQNSKSSLVSVPGSTQGYNGVPRASATVVDTEKLLAAKKRRQETVDKKSSSANRTTGRRTWKQRLKLSSTVLVSLSLILSAASLLFTCLIVVDPIVVGLRAQFHTEPGLCRTAFSRNVTGPAGCVMPSCREGCTADLYACTFIFVVYYERMGLNISIEEDEEGVQLISWDQDAFLASVPQFWAQETGKDLPSEDDNSTNVFYNATLMINPNGCGYLPEVNCSNFEDKYNRPGALFPCFYSPHFKNEEGSRVALPFYSREAELLNLSLSLGIPLCLLVLLSCFLFILLRWSPGVQRNTVSESLEDSSIHAFSAFTKSSKLRDSFGHDASSLSRQDSGAALEPKPASGRLNGHGPKRKEAVNNGGGSFGIGDLVSDLSKGKGPPLTSRAMSRPLLANGGPSFSQHVVVEDNEDLPSSSASIPLPVIGNSVPVQALKLL